MSRRGKTPAPAGGDHVSEGGATGCSLPPPCARPCLALGRWTDGWREPPRGAQRREHGNSCYPRHRHRCY